MLALTLGDSASVQGSMVGVVLSRDGPRWVCASSVLSVNAVARVARL